MSEVKLPEGYKQTEVGVIPEDWEVKDIGEALTIKHGKDQKQVESSSGQYPIFGTGGQMGWANNFLYNKPSVLIGRKGSINKPRYIDVPFWTVDTLFYSQVHNGYDEKFMFYKFCLIDWMNYNEASGVPSLNASTISNVKISVPKKLEQTAIATALSDVDNLIQSLEKLIAKKEAIKTGTMQHLLTGKTRLPEFATHENGSAKGFKQTELGRIPEDWKVVSLGEAVEFLDGQRKPIKASDRAKINGIYPYYGASGIVDYVNDYIFDEDLILLGEDGDNILSRNSPLSFKVSGKIWVNNHAHVLRPNQNFNITFLTSFLESLDYALLNSGTAQPKLNKATCLKIKVAKPPKNEQTAIATVLSDMDAEIQALQQRLDKTRDIKQGMMQQLLTGKVRLAH